MGAVFLLSGSWTLMGDREAKTMATAAAISIFFYARYRLSRERHAEILAALKARQSEGHPPSAGAATRTFSAWARWRSRARRSVPSSRPCCAAPSEGPG